MFPAILSSATLEERIRHHLETLEAAPGDKEAFQALEALYQKHGRFEELLRLYEERARLFPEPGAAPELLARAAELARQRLRDPVRAEALYRQVLDAAPRHAAALRAIGEIRRDRGDFAGLAEALEEEADRTDDPKASAARYLSVGRVFEERLSRRDRAALFYVRAWRLDPALAEARTRALACMVALRRYGQAKRMLDSARTGGAEHAALAGEYARLGAVLAQEPLEHGLAVEALAEALALDRRAPGAAAALEKLKATPRTWREQAKALAAEAAKSRDRREAAQLHLRAAELHAAYDADAAPRIREHLDRIMLAWPGMPQSLDFLERWYGEREDWRGFRDELARLAGATRDRAALAALHLRLARVDLVRFGDGDRALASLLRAHELDPASEQAALQAFEMHVDAGRTGEALGVLERHLAAAPQKPQHAPLRHRAAEMALSGLGDRERARRHLEAALRAAPGFAPAAKALAPLLQEAGEWRRLVEVLELRIAAEPDAAQRARLLEQIAEIQIEKLGSPREGMRQLGRSLQLDPSRALTRKALEAAAAQAGAFLDLARAYRTAADAAADNPRTRKTLLRRVAEIQERDLGQVEEAVRAYRALVQIDPEDKGAQSALEACLARAGQHAEVAAGLARRIAEARGREKRELAIKLARIHLEAGEPERAAAAWQEVLAAGGDDPEALRGLAAALEAQGGKKATAELVPVLGRLAALGGPDRVELETKRAALLLDPLERLGESAAAWLALLRGGGLAAPQVAQAVAALEKLLARGVDPVRIAQALAPLHAAAGEPHKHVAMLELLADKLPEDADPRERTRLLLDAATIRAERLGDLRGALDAASAALRTSPGHAEARRRCEELASRVGAFGELYALLVETASRLEKRPEDERALRLRAAQLAEQELGSSEDAAAQLRRCLELAPSDLDVLASLTRIALAAERWEESCDLLLERARLASVPEKTALLTQLADTLLERLRSPQAAASVYRQALELTPSEHRTRLLPRLARALELAGDPEGQARVLSDLASSSPDPGESARAAVQTARLHEERGDRKGAVESYRAALERNPGDSAPLAALEALLGEPDPEVALGAARALRPAYERLRDPRKRVRALEVEARALGEPAARAAAFREAASLRERELGQPAEAFADLAEAVRAVPVDPLPRQEMRRLAEESHQAEACARVYEEILLALKGESAVQALRELAEWTERALANRARAAACLERVRTLVQGDARALAGLRRLYRGSERWADLCDACAEMASRSGDPAERAELWREVAATAETRLSDLARAADAWRKVADLDPGDPAAVAALERLNERLDRAEDLAWALERRRAAGDRDPDVSFRLAELKRTRLDDPAGALALHAEILRADPTHEGARDALVALSRTPGPIGREALAMADALLRALGEHARRVEAREGRLANIDDPAERARLHAEIRIVLESDLGQPGEALQAARRALTEGGRSREEALRELPRLAQAAGRPEDLARAYEEAAPAGSGAEALDLLRRAARARERIEDRAGAVADWKKVLEASPDDAEVLEALDRLFSGQASARERLDVVRRRAGRARGGERWRLLVQSGDLLAGTLGDGAGAAAAYRGVLAEDPGNAAALEALDWLLTREKRAAELAPVLAALAEARRSDPVRRTEALVRRAALLEVSADPREAIEAYGTILAESPQEPAAVAGLGRLLSRPDARGAAARLLEDVHRAAGDARKLVALLDLRLEDADASERAPLLAEMAALHERLGQRPQAFLAKLRQYRETLRKGGDDPAVRAELERLAGETASFEDLAGAFEDALEQGASGATAVELRRRLGTLYAERLQDPAKAARWLEEAAAAAPSAEIFGALARLYRKQNAFRELAEVHRRHAALAADVSQKKDLLFEVATIMEDHLSDRDGAMEAYRQILAVDPEDPNALRLLSRLLGSAERWDELTEVLEREVAIADRRPNFGAEAVELRFRLGRMKQQRLADLPGALECYRGVLAKVPRHPAALAALEELARSAGPASAEAANLLEPVYQQEGEHQKLVETLEARLASLEKPADRAAVLRRVAQVYAGPLRNAEQAFLTSGRALREDPDAPETLDLAERLAEAAALEEELAALLAENADRARDPRARAEYRRRLARIAGRAGGDPARAGEEWQRVLDLVPDDAEALEALTGLQRAAGAGESSPRCCAGGSGSRRIRAAGPRCSPSWPRCRRSGSRTCRARWRACAACSRPIRAPRGAGPARRLCVKTERWVELADVLAREATAAAAAGDAGAAVVLRYRLAELKETRLLDREGALALYEEILPSGPTTPRPSRALEGAAAARPANARAARPSSGPTRRRARGRSYAAVLEVRASERPDPVERKALFRALAEVREQRLEYPELAFLALCRAFRDDPTDAALRSELERLSRSDRAPGGAGGHLRGRAASGCRPRRRAHRAEARRPVRGAARRRAASGGVLRAGPQAGSDARARRPAGPRPALPQARALARARRGAVGDGRARDPLRGAGRRSSSASGSCARRSSARPTRPSPPSSPSAPPIRGTCRRCGAWSASTKPGAGPTPSTRSSRRSGRRPTRPPRSASRSRWPRWRPRSGEMPRPPPSGRRC